MPFKTTLARSAGKLFGVFRQRDTSLRGFEQQDRMSRSEGPITATGGNKYTPGNGYIYHAFTNSMNSTPDGTFEQSSGGATMDILIVAGGGGGGGGYYAGGGGGGGILEGVLPHHQPGTFIVSVGGGGAGGDDLDGPFSTNGENSVFGSVTALGGGLGGDGPVPGGSNPDGGDGGSGGGSSYYAYPGKGSALPQPAPGDYTAYGNDGGPSRMPGTVGGGGGGAGASPPSTPTGGISGGAGQPFGKWPSSVIPILTPLNPHMGPSNNTYGGGGGNGAGGLAGVGGGGAYDLRVGIDYLGGGAAGATGNATGGGGGDGIVLIRYSAT